MPHPKGFPMRENIAHIVTNRVAVEVQSDGLTKLIITDPSGLCSAYLTPHQAATLVQQLCKASMHSYKKSSALHCKPHHMPLLNPADVYIAASWPLGLILSVIEVNSEHPPGIALVAPFGLMQIAIGIQRGQLKKLAEQLLSLDEMLPQSDLVETGLH
jgi:hypothetical protein